MRTMHGVLLVALTAGSAAAAEPIRREAAAQVQEADPARMTVQELERIRIPADAKIVLRPLGAAVAALPVELHTADMVAKDPHGDAALTNGAAVGFPQVPGPGWRVDWWVKNQGNVNAPVNRAKFECSVANVAPGPQANYLYNRWCKGFQGVPQIAPLAAGATSPPIKSFIGTPLFPCAHTNAPKPKFVVTVDSLNEVPEAGVANGNNVRTFELCINN